MVIGEIKMKSNYLNMTKIKSGINWFVAVVMVLAGITFIPPILSVLFGYLGGLIIRWIFGDIIVEALNTLFGTTRFTTGHVPMIAALLAWIGSYFRISGNKESKS